MRRFCIPAFSIAILAAFPAPSGAVTGSDAAPGQPCSIEKAMTMTANPAGVGGYIMSCEGGQWVAQITASTPTQPDQVATKKYVDDQVATIETHTYVNPTWRTKNGNVLPILITLLGASRKGAVAAALCSQFSDGAYVQGKFLSVRPITQAYTTGAGNYTTYCAGSCITGSSGQKYAWMTEQDFYVTTSFYGNWTPSDPELMDWQNPGEVSTNNCSSWTDPTHGLITVNGECMAEATSTKTTLSGQTSPSYHWGAGVIESIICWSN